MAALLLKEHAVFFVIAACAATATATWVVSENVRVKPANADVERAVQRCKALEDARQPPNPSTPVISDIVLSKVKNDAGHDFERNLFFKDAEGDAAFVSFVILGSNANQLNVRSANVAAAPEQIKGSVLKLPWVCVRTSYFVKLRVYLTDSAGNVSRPRDITLNC